MIFGKTWIDQFSPQWVFAWFPTELNDGRYAWLQKVWRIYPDPNEYGPYHPRYFASPPELFPQEPVQNVQR